MDRPVGAFDLATAVLHTTLDVDPCPRRCTPPIPHPSTARAPWATAMSSHWPWEGSRATRFAPAGTGSGMGDDDEEYSLAIRPHCRKAPTWRC